jgi:hypothetical protein
MARKNSPKSPPDTDLLKKIYGDGFLRSELARADGVSERTIYDYENAGLKRANKRGPAWFTIVEIRRFKSGEPEPESPRRIRTRKPKTNMTPVRTNAPAAAAE